VILPNLEAGEIKWRCSHLVHETLQI